MVVAMTVFALIAQDNNVPKELPNPVTLTITSAETGDRGCYLSGTQNNKAESEWSFMAEHGCEYLLEVGKRYVLAVLLGCVPRPESR